MHLPLLTLSYPTTTMKLSFSLTSLVHLAFAAQYTLASPYHGYSSEYSFDANYNHAPRWMTLLPSSTNLTSLSIPGTHDTMTATLTNEIFQCQSLRLGTQLEAGLRYFDIRARLVNNTLSIYHGDQDTQHPYPEVLSILFKFLDTNPGETILMRLKEESSAINSTIDFVTAFNHYRLTDPKTAPGSKKHFWTPPHPGPSVVPTLGELRSKILILQNFGQEPAEYGIKWESPLLNIQDHYEVPDLYSGLDEKFEAITQGLEDAGNGTAQGDGVLYLGHLSASVGVLPIEAAAGNREGSVTGMNDRTGKWLISGGGGGTGVVIIDFPGQKLAQEVLSRNPSS